MMTEAEAKFNKLKTDLQTIGEKSAENLKGMESILKKIMNLTETKIKKLISEAAGLCYQVNATTSHGAALRVSGCTGNIEITFYNVKSDGLDSEKTGEWVRLFDDFVQVKGSFTLTLSTNAELINNLRDAITFLKAKLQEAQNG